MLDTLAKRDELTWSYSYDNARSRALFQVALPGEPSRTLLTKEAENLAQSLTNKLRIVWLPVPHWGGEDKWEKTVAQIDSMKHGELPKPWE